MLTRSVLESRDGLLAVVSRRGWIRAWALRGLKSHKPPDCTWTHFYVTHGHGSDDSVLGGPRVRLAPRLAPAAAPSSSVGESLDIAGESEWPVGPDVGEDWRGSRGTLLDVELRTRLRVDYLANVARVGARWRLRHTLKVETHE